jgi:hypothetical protein
MTLDEGWPWLELGMVEICMKRSGLVGVWFRCGCEVQMGGVPVPWRSLRCPRHWDQ